MDRLIIALLLLVLGACARIETPEIVPVPQARQMPMASLADRLNARYNSTVQNCADGTPAYNCSGILIRRATYNAAYDFWGHSADATRLGSTTYSYIRNGLNSSSADIASGYILMDLESARAAGKIEPNARCIFPFMADTQANNRAMHGCGFANRPSPDPLPSDLSNCATLAVPAITPAAWMANFNEHGSDRINQCSLSTAVAGQFMTSLTVRTSYPDLTKLYGNEILFELWDTQTPANLPIEAIFYSASKEGSLINAQALKHAYQVKTNIELPIVRLDFGTGATRFAMRDVDQEDGWQVAQRLNERYANLTAECAGAKAAVYCSGVLARAISYSVNYKAWNPNLGGTQPGSVSFSFLRGDVVTLAMYLKKAQGVIFSDPQYSEAEGLTPLDPLCIYMNDGATDLRANLGCGKHPYYADSQSCASQGITTLEKFKAHYFAVTGPEYQRYHQCSLDIAPEAVMLALNARREFFSGDGYTGNPYNEVLIAAWPMNIPSQLPLDGFYYVAGSTAAEGLRQAKEIQKDFWRSTQGQIKPVVKLDLTATAGGWFTYVRGDQAY